jgi:CxxC-x17-CxxC domain-containing protein
MGDYNNRDDRSSGGYRGGRSSFGGGRGGFSRGGSRGGFSGGSKSFGGDRGDRQMFDAVCDNCGKSCQVPFRPTQGKPVYCSDCFEKMGGRDRDQSNDRQTSNDRPRFEERPPRPPQPPQGGPDFGAINAKLDKILSILEPKAVAITEAQKKTESTEKVSVKSADKSAKSVVAKKPVKKVASEK